MKHFDEMLSHSQESLDFYSPNDDLIDIMDVLQVDACTIPIKTHQEKNCFQSMNEIQWSENDKINKKESIDFASQYHSHIHILSPFPLIGSTSTLIIEPEQYKSYILLFGGVSQTCTNINQNHPFFQKTQKPYFFAFDLDLFKWYEFLPKGNIPLVNRYYHCSTIVSPKSNKASCLWIFGGRMNPNELCTNDVFSFSLRDNKWTQYTKSKYRTYPPARYDASALFVKSQGSEGTIILYGGHDCNNCVMNDLWLWDVETCSWEKPTLIGISPCLGCCMIALVEIKLGKILFWENNDDMVDAKKCHTSNINNTIQEQDKATNYLLDLQNETWIQSYPAVTTKHVCSSLSNSLSSFSFEGLYYRYLILMSRDGKLNLLHVKQWKWSILGTIHDVLNMDDKITEAWINEIQHALDMMKNARSKTTSEELKQVYDISEATLEQLLHKNILYPYSKLCHIVLRRGSKIYAIGELREYSQIHTLIIIPLNKTKKA